MFKRHLTNLETRKYDDKKLQRPTAQVKREYQKLSNGYPNQRDPAVFFILKELSTYHWRHKYPVRAR
jgi:hypothetical protein